MTLTWAVVAAALTVGALVPVLLRRPPSTAGPLALARSRHAELLHALETTDAEPSVVTLARERLTTCGGLLSRADTPAQCRRAEQAAAEGLALLRPPAADPPGQRPVRRGPRRGWGRTRSGGGR